MRKTLCAIFVVASALALIGVFFAAPPADAKPKLNPIIFVHGGSGSAAQFETQALRFASNGYPPRYITALEYDSSSIYSILPQVLAELDALIAELQAETGRAQVDLLGHSLGTFVSHTYLASSPARAANVAHYVNIDGASAAAPPGGVPTLALWAGASPPAGQPVGHIYGAINVTLEGHEHVECATSAEAFFEMYHFFRGEAPATTDIVPEPPGLVSIEGRADLFPENTGVDGATLEIWEVDGDTGYRTGMEPLATRQIDASGKWGPIDEVMGGKHYEFALLREGEVDVRWFYEPFLRSDHLVRLNLAVGLAPYIDKSEDHVTVTITRDKEFCANLGAGSDVLSVDGTDVINMVTAPCDTIPTSPAAFFVFDDNSDGVSNVLSVPFPFPWLAFLTATDLYVPAAPPGTVSVVTVPRNSAGVPRTVNVPNTPSTEARLVVRLNDFEQ